MKTPNHGCQIVFCGYQSDNPLPNVDSSGAAELMLTRKLITQ